MAHSHDPHDRHGGVAVVDGGGYGAGFLMALAVLLVLAVIGFALLWTQPWDDDDNGIDTSPGIGNPLEGGDPGTGDGDGGGGGGGTGGGGTDGGGEAPPSGQ